jgi:hypothetical protein
MGFILRQISHIPQQSAYISHIPPVLPHPYLIYHNFEMMVFEIYTDSLVRSEIPPFSIILIYLQSI